MQVQLERLTASFQNVTEDMRQRFVVDGQTMLDESIIGTSPIGSFRSNSLKNAFRRASVDPSGQCESYEPQVVLYMDCFSDEEVAIVPASFIFCHAVTTKLGLCDLFYRHLGAKDEECKHPRELPT